MSRRKVLIVEDDRDFQRALGVRLQGYGYQVLRANDAIQAVQTAKREDPDLIVLDLGLPGGDGFTVMDRLAWVLPMAKPVVVLTGRDPLTNRQKALESGAVAFLQKPVNNQMLHAAIRRALGEDQERRLVAVQ